MTRALLAGVLLCAAAARAAAGVVVTAELSRDKVAIDEQPTLSVTVTGDQASLPTPRLPPIEDFSVYDAGRSQSYSFVNGKVSASVVYQYVLNPRRVGKFRIPSIAADGATPSAPLEVEVVPAGAHGSAPPPAAQAQAPAAALPAPGPARAAPRRDGRKDVFVTASLDKPRAYVNQQVTLTIRFLSDVQLLGDVRYDPPETPGFLSEELPPVRNGVTQLDGRAYQFSEIKVALFPIQAGKLKIGPASVHCQVPRMGGGGGGMDFFDRFMAMATPEPVTVNTEPLTLQADPLPPGKPDDFSGVVGKLAAKVAADRTSVKAGDAVTLTVSVSGTGNVKSVPEPRKPDVPALRFFATESSASVDKTSDRVGGTKTFKMVAVPRVSGDIRVPPFQVSYFDPERKAYQRAATGEVRLQVAPGAPASAIAAAPAASAPGLTEIADDIRYLKTSPERAPVSAALAAFADLGPWHAAPLAALAGALLVAWRRRAAELDPRGRRFREALPRAEARLKEAAALPASEAARAAALVDEALAAFVADKLDVPAAGLTLKTALEGLKRLKTPPSPAALERLRAAWEEADLRRFAPNAAGDDARRFADETAALLKALDAEVRR